MNRTQTLLIILLALAALNAGYLTYRYILVNHVDPSLVGTSICSFTDTIDCDKVLSTPQARAFIVPNAILGLAFHIGCLVWAFVGYRLEQKYWRMVGQILRGMLLMGAGFTFVFWFLLLNLSVFCVLCPVNHFLIYLSLLAVHLLVKKRDTEVLEGPKGKVWVLAAVCVALFFVFQLIWLLVWGNDVDLAFHLFV